MNFNSVKMRNIRLLKAHYEVEDRSSLKLATWKRGYVLLGEVQVTAREDVEL